MSSENAAAGSSGGSAWPGAYSRRISTRRVFGASNVSKLLHHIPSHHLLRGSVPPPRPHLRLRRPHLRSPTTGGESAARTLLPISPPGGAGASDTTAAAAAAIDGSGVAVDTGPATDPGGVRLLGNVRGYGGASLALERVSAAANRSAAPVLQRGRWRWRRRRRRSSGAGA
ncbi:hypothetical protein SASPL_135479 [Salvia splendens]|uniref:Uncharacterized protein n=1 Tax=Salvia splendens TaxID=180675 RepID=A0A8X8ZFT9_SALSN|nr:uncharacterized protein LOC121761203 [Salvia splendens]KAG6403262.1 hypothetical protein SASPL_135479 [Salvia splendens]